MTSFKKMFVSLSIALGSIGVAFAAAVDSVAVAVDHRPAEFAQLLEFNEAMLVVSTAQSIVHREYNETGNDEITRSPEGGSDVLDYFARSAAPGDVQIELTLVDYKITATAGNISLWLPDRSLDYAIPIVGQ